MSTFVPHPTMTANVCFFLQRKDSSHRQAFKHRQAQAEGFLLLVSGADRRTAF